MNRLHIGTMGWSYDFWVGKLYPEGTTSKGFLSEYSKHFNTVEIDSTFYRIPSKETVMKWKEQTPADFLFSAKFPRIITHVKMLQECEDEVKVFIERISQLQNKLGLLLLQFPSTFKPEHLHLLRDFLPSLPRKHRFVVEVRNRKLLEDHFYSVLKENGVALALVDSPFMPSVEVMPTDFAYVRWEGDRRQVKGLQGQVEIDRTDSIMEWAKRIKAFLDSSKNVFGYFSKYYSGYPSNDADQLLSFIDA
jgi:uncharacterized protein YecE (DUF72 family)